MFEVMFILIIAAFLIGGFLGYIFAKREFNGKTKGVLRIDSSDPDGPYMFLELETDPNLVKNDQYITLKVDTRSYISQK